ncbi:hypothetical protein BKA70DRAFT_1575873 [Coprinopsis sp. MPI-PUGE-AT-0042]|nr:hypothetical protein BKA70DRAFT_1575873 [Coprinopsis sp. MPI-PUGE-AT-0042]
MSSDKITIKTRILPEDDAAFLYPLLATLQLCLSAYALVKFRRLSLEQQQSRRRYIFLLLLIFCLSATRFVLYLRENTPYIVNGPGSRRYVILIASPEETAISFGCTAALSLVGDAFLVWRATVVWSHKRVLRWLPTILYTCSFGVCVSSFVFKRRSLRAAIAAAATEPTEKQVESIPTTQALTWRIADFTMSVVVSIVTTVLIIARLLLVRKKMQNLGNDSQALRSTLPYMQIIVLLLESTVPFTLVGATAAIMHGFIDLKENKNMWALDAFPILIVLWTNSLALGPQFIALRIICGTSSTATNGTPVCLTAHSIRRRSYHIVAHSSHQ